MFANRDNVRQNKKNGRITISALLLSLIVCLSFFSHLFFYTFSAGVYLVVFILLVLGFVVVKPIELTKNPILVWWIPAMICIIVSYLHSQRTAGALVDLLILNFGLLMIFFHTRNNNDYQGTMKCILFLAMFFAIGILLNSLFPSLFLAVLSMFPSSYSAVVLQEMSRRVTGFSTNVGFSAGYVISGIIVMISRIRKKEDFLNFKTLELIVLVIALMYTGKRGHAVFLVMTLVLCYLIPVRSWKKVKRYWNIIFVLVAFAVLYVFFSNVLTTIPVVSEISKSISGLLVGEDVSSGRKSLYLWAVELFLRYPWFGIGWGDYKSTVVGNATIIARLDVHNIYLQLLCETGIIGFVCIVSTFLVFWNAARQAYKQCVHSTDPAISSMLPIVYFSFAYQTFFLLYGLTGNTLYDQHYQILYMFSCAITMTYRHRVNAKSLG